MCGIAGILTFDSASPDEICRRVDQMLNVLGHRGPDGRGVWSTSFGAGQCVALGHVRLAIIDLSDGGRQPMVRDGNAVVFNGEIYNYQDLRTRLSDAGEIFRTQSDTEVLLASYRQSSVEFPNDLDGMFAFGVWNTTERTLLLGRDRFGIKPLYFHRTPRHLVFASELRAVLASGLVPATLDETSVWHYVGYQTTPTPRTLIQDIRMLEPGHVLEVTGGGAVSDRRYWDLGHAASRQEIPTSLAAAQARTGDLLTAAVKSHLVSDVPVGVFLSGGLDSSALLSALHASGTKAQTFTIALDEADLDESAAAAAVARQFGADHTEIRLRAGDLVDSLPDILNATDHPSGDGVNTSIVAQAVRDRGLKVALSGLGGDEVFGGYASFRRLAKLAGPAPMLKSAPLQVRRAAASAVRMTGRGSVASEKAAAVLESQGSIAEMWPITRQLFSAAARSELLSDRVPRAGDAYTAMLSRALSEDVAMEVFGQVSVAETRAYMHDVLLRDTDQMSMSHGLEVRVPMLDHRLAAYVVAVPDRWKAAGRLPKPLLTGCLEHPLPRSVSAAPKRGFVLPFDAWMRGALRAFCERQLGEQGLEGRGLLRPGEARRLWSGFLERRPGITWGRVWTLVALNAWLERRSL